MATSTMDVRVFRDRDRWRHQPCEGRRRESDGEGYLRVDRDPNDWEVVKEPDGWEFT
jgi:hypothetical protein